MAGLLVFGVGAAAAADATRISNPDGTVVDVVTTATGSTVTSYDPQGAVTSKLRYPTYKGEEGHQAILLYLAPPGAKFEKQ
ncbi:MAG: hypothetical protein AAF615_01570 [Pseudomonadota bacterium]